MGLAIVAMGSGLCCCFPLGLIAGIVSLVSANGVNGRLLANDLAGARTASERAAFWGWMAIVAGVIGVIIQIIVFALYGNTLTESLR